jgi:[NiFe] hydrogenase diaphorase moiety large subunit
MAPGFSPSFAPQMAGMSVAEVDDILAEFRFDRTRLMDIVLAIQHRFGHVSDASVEALAKGLKIHPVEVEDMVSFYAFFDRVPRGRFRIRLSQTAISRIKGADAVARAFEHELAIAMGQTTSDGEFTLEWTSDIGMADQEPSALINGVVLTALAPGDVPDIIAALRRSGHDGGLPPYPPHRAQFAGLPKAGVRSGLVRAGPLLSELPESGIVIKAALGLTPDAVIEQITSSKLRGRGGAGFPTGMKWRLTRKSQGTQHYVVCNADEGEPGTFKDRVLLSEFPDLVFDGMTVAAYAMGSGEGLVYLRGEYAYLWDHLQAVLETRRQSGWLGKAIGGRTGFDFDIRIQLGAGAYICGEESSLLESLEGKRGAPRDRPPFPTEHGYLGQPTAIDNVETFVCAARIMEKGAPWFAQQGTKLSTGTKLISVAGDCAHPGVYEVPFGITVNALLDLVGGSDAAFVQISGASGQSLAPRDFGRQIAFEDLSTGGSTMVFGPQRDVLDIALQFANFFVDESCGWCAPCRIGTTQLKLAMEKVVAGRATHADLIGMEALSHTVMRMSRCGLGQMAPNPILSTMKSFPELYEARLRKEAFVPARTLDQALSEAVAVQGRKSVMESS